jgi:hypothetical protein
MTQFRQAGGMHGAKLIFKNVIKRPFGRSMRRRKENIVMDFTEM